MDKDHITACAAEPTCAELMEALKAMESRALKAEARVEDLEAQVEDLKAKLKQSEADAKAEIQAQKKLTTERERELDRYKQENVRLRRVNNSLTKLRDNLCAQIHKHEKDLENLSRELREALEEVQKQADLAKRYSDLATTTEQRAQKLDASLTELKTRTREIRKRLQQLKREDAENVLEIQRLVKEQEKLQKEINRIRVQNSKDFKNSGIPSSACPGKPVLNSRQPTGRKRGAQVNHPFWGRKPAEKSEGCECLSSKVIPPDEKFLDTDLYEPTGTYLVHQRKGIEVRVVYEEAKSEGYLNKRTGKIEYTRFPEKFANDVSFSGEIKSLIYSLTHRCNASIGKTKQFLHDLTRGALDVSTGCICNLAKEFARKSKQEQQAAFDSIAQSKVVHADFTFGRMDSKLVTVMIMATPDGHALFQAKPKKGLSALEGSPLKVDVRGADDVKEQITVTDHEVTFAAHCGTAHQECLEHVKRNLREASQQEKDLKWHKQMMTWISNSIHWRNQVLDEEEEYTEEKVEEFLAEYNRILELGKAEYTARGGQPLPGYNGGINLLKRLTESPEEYTLFLKDLDVPPTNNLSELLARLFKRKAHQVMSFRSMGGVEAWCAFQTAVMEIMAEGKAVFESVAEIFDRPYYSDCKNERKPRGKNRSHTKAIRKAAGLDPEMTGDKPDSTSPPGVNPQAAAS